MGASILNTCSLNFPTTTNRPVPVEFLKLHFAGWFLFSEVVIKDQFLWSVFSCYFIIAPQDEIPPSCEDQACGCSDGGQQRDSEDT